MNNIYQLKITLLDSEPPIWRRILVKADTLLPDLHKIIQTSMGWTNSHLHQFISENQSYGIPDDEWDESETTDYSSVKLSDLISAEKEKILYEYDFGDGWEHEIILEKVLTEEDNKYYPSCIDGKRNCPPEDCGGMGGYEHLIKVIQDPNDDEHEEMKVWVGENFNPEDFNLNEVNEALKEDDFGCITLD